MSILGLDDQGYYLLSTESSPDDDRFLILKMFLSHNLKKNYVPIFFLRIFFREFGGSKIVQKRIDGGFYAEKSRCTVINSHHDD